ncbi:unnamed protein product, partial [Didymodactylos carnosus]
MLVWFLDASSIEEKYIKVLKKRWDQLSNVITGIRRFHHFQPIKVGEIKCGIIANSTSSSSFNMLESKKKTAISPIYSVYDLRVGDYVIVVYTDKWWLARVTNLDKSSGSVDVEVHTQSGPRLTFTATTIPKIAKLTDVLGRLNSKPKATPRTVS